MTLPTDVFRYALTRDLVESEYRELIEVAADRSTHFLCVVREPDWMDPGMVEFLEQVAPHVIAVEERSEWPGTVLLDDFATIYRIHPSPRVTDAVMLATDHLFGWLQPALPEDLSFLHEGGMPWMTTISHENDGYMDLTLEQFDSLTTEIPWVSRAVRREQKN
jgi:hypothetical protein